MTRREFRYFRAGIYLILAGICLLILLFGLIFGVLACSVWGFIGCTLFGGLYSFTADDYLNDD
jgi:hypothetical protein